MKQYIQPEIIKANRLARILRSQNSPHRSVEALRFWELCSSGVIDVAIAKKLYIKAGYHPFKGYPLVRSKK